jgi:hypothetical protein
MLIVEIRCHRRVKDIRSRRWQMCEDFYEKQKLNQQYLPILKGVTIKAVFLYACSGDLFCHKLRIVCEQIYFLDRGKAQAGVRSWGEIRSRFPAESLPENK